jgi:membrane protein implicated in regulation of membrane protease activity
MVMWIVAAVAYICAMAFAGLVPVLILGAISIFVKVYLTDWWEVYREVAMVIIAIVGYHNWKEYKRKTTPKYTLSKDL